MATPKKQNVFQAARSIVRENRKISGLKKQIAAKQALRRALPGGQVSGLSSRAASALANDPNAFNGGGTSSRPRKRKP